MPDPLSDTPVRVLHLITLFSLGGATENTLLTVEGLQQLGYDVEIITGPPIASEGDMFAEARARGVRVKVIQILKRSIHPLLDARAFVRVFWMIREGRYQIVHTHSSKAGVLGRLASLSWSTPFTGFRSMISCPRRPGGSSSSRSVSGHPCRTV